MRCTDFLLKIGNFRSDRFIIWSYQECFSIAVHPFLLHPVFCICIAERDKLTDYLLVLIVLPVERNEFFPCLDRVDIFKRLKECYCIIGVHVQQHLIKDIQIFPPCLFSVALLYIDLPREFSCRDIRSIYFSYLRKTCYCFIEALCRCIHLCAPEGYICVLREKGGSAFYKFDGKGEISRLCVEMHNS